MRLNKGINLGGWLSQCDNDVKHFEEFIKEEDLKKIKELGFDHVRIPVDYFVFEDENANFISNCKYVERAIEWTRKYDLDMVLDLHKSYGYSFDVEGAAQGFFHSGYKKARFLRLWEYIATKYHNYKDTVAFELLNEVTDRSVSDIWNGLLQDAIKRIRAIDSDVTIIVGGTSNNSANDLVNLPVIKDPNLIYTFHCYDPLIFTHQGAYWVKTMPTDFRCNFPLTKEIIELSDKLLGPDYGTIYDLGSEDELLNDIFTPILKRPIDFAKENGLQLYCGEYGVINLADKKQKLNWLKAINEAFEKNNIRRCIWSYKQMDFGITDEENDCVIDEIMKYV